jgi:CBS domain containing-hemolysin-like protein
VFDFGDLTARELMVPRTEMLAVDADAPLHELIHFAIKNPRSKFPVYEGDLDHIIGVAHVKDLVRTQHDERRSTTIRGVMREALFVPDTIRLDNLLKQFRAKKQHLAIVLDEYGGTAGLVTLDDLMEQLVGEVQDPFDKSTPEIQRLPDGSALLDGLTLIETINETFGLGLKDEYYDTIAGFVLGRLGRMAKVGDSVEADGLRLRVEALDGLRIARLSLSLAKPAENGTAGV